MENLKICGGSHNEKPINKFLKEKRNKSGLASYCKECVALSKAKYLKTKKWIISTIYDSQKLHSKKRGHRPPEYTKQELKEWAYSQQLFHELYNEWVRSGYKTRLKPSVDRKHDNIHYCIGNIQLMNFRENEMKKAISLECKVIQYDMNNNFIEEYKSVNEASRKTEINHGNISHCCNNTNRAKTAGGFVWKYKKD